MKPICVPCQRFYRPTKNGRAFVEGMPIGSVKAPPGITAPELWKPYKLWRGDEWTCMGCGAIIIVGVAQHTIAEHFESTFDEQVKSHKADLQINDC